MCHTKPNGKRSQIIEVFVAFQKSQFTQTKKFPQITYQRQEIPLVTMKSHVYTYMYLYIYSILYCGLFQFLHPVSS